MWYWPSEALRARRARTAAVTTISPIVELRLRRGSEEYHTPLGWIPYMIGFIVML